MYKLMFNKFFTTKGRGSRKEYAIKFFATCFIFFIANYTRDYADKSNDFLAILYMLAIVLLMYISLIQYFLLAIRRLHDLNASGWYVLLTFVPFGQFLILWLMFKKGTVGSNKYGEPLEY